MKLKLKNVTAVSMHLLAVGVIIIPTGIILGPASTTDDGTGKGFAVAGVILLIIPLLFIMALTYALIYRKNRNLNFWLALIYIVVITLLLGYVSWASTKVAPIV